MSVELAIDQENSRRATRRSMFVSAVVAWQGQRLAVRIRNMSSNGVMVEAPELPPQGSDVLLARGSLSVSGRVAWIAEGACGIALGQDVDVGKWTAKPANARQEEIDRLVASHQAGNRQSEAPILKDRALPDQAEVAAIKAEISQLGELLIADPYVVAKHGEALQVIDRAEQMLAALVKHLPD